MTMAVSVVKRACSMLFLALACGAAAAQTASTSPGPAYPAKPVRVLVGFTPGGSSDIVARILSQKLIEAWGQQVVVDNRPGAGANIAAELVAKSPPDGYTLIVTQNSLAVSPSLYPKLGYDAKRDLVPVTSIAAAPHILVVHPSLPVKDVKQLIALARSRAGELTFSSSGIGINDHMAGELFRSMAQLKVVHVPYKGGAQAAGDVLSGQISYYFAGMPVGLPMYKQGRLKALAVTSKERYKGASELPTMAEAGMPGYEVILWQGVFAPAGLDPKVIAKISADVNRIQHDPDTVARLDAVGMLPFAGTPESFKAFYDAEYAKWGKVIKAAGIKLE
jgi:tripartite-type tricarboxylate transporter receptor subunit TctC